MQPAGMTDAQLQAHLAKQRQQALTEMQANPTAVAERMRAAGASEDDIASVFQRAGVSYPRVDVGTIRTRFDEVPIRARTGTTTLPSGTIPPRTKDTASSRLGYRKPASVGQPLPDADLDDKILQQNLKPRRK
mgnify:CR=1 FL=1